MDTASVFPRFLELPIELRVEIWRHAVRPHLHGAHFFSVTNAAIGRRCMRHLAISDPGAKNACECIITAPMKWPRLAYPSHSWRDGNPSTYMWDSGLWTACKESREVLRRAYAKQPDLHKSCPGPWARPCLFDTSTFRYNGETWCFAVFPRQDLVCFQPVNMASSGRRPDFPPMPPALHQTDGWNLFRHIAIEYDVSWFCTQPVLLAARELLEEDSPRGFFLRALHAMTGAWNPWQPRIWLIDYTLRRHQTPKSAAYSDQLAVFYANGWRFVEVDETTCARKRGNEKSAIHFVVKMKTSFGFTFEWSRHLQAKGLEWARGQQAMAVREPCLSDHPRSLIGVLCCEKLEV